MYKLKKDYLEDFYELVYVSESKNSLIKMDLINQWIKQDKITLIPESKVSESNNPNEIHYISYKTRKGKICQDANGFVGHLRNAFCHCNTEECIDKFFLKDYEYYDKNGKKKKKPKLSMSGEIEKEKLFNLINLIKQL